MSAGRAGRAAAVALLTAALAAPAAFGAAPPTAVTGVKAGGPHTVQVLVKAAGDLATSDVEADLGGRFAFVERVRPAGPVRRTDLVFAVDTSGSMAGAPIAAATAAGQRLLDAVGRSGRVGLVTFSDTARVVRPLTSNTASVRTALAGLETHSGTALYDGIALAADTLTTGSDSSTRRIVVVLSDGADTASSTPLARLTRSLHAAGVEVDAVGLESSPSFRAEPLREIAAATGGELAPTRTLAGLEPIALQLSQTRLSTTYAVDVNLPASGARSLRVSVRGGRPATVRLPDGVSGATRQLLDRPRRRAGRHPWRRCRRHAGVRDRDGGGAPPPAALGPARGVHGRGRERRGARALGLHARGLRGARGAPRRAVGVEAA